MGKLGVSLLKQTITIDTSIDCGLILTAILNQKEVALFVFAIILYVNNSIKSRNYTWKNVSGNKDRKTVISGTENNYWKHLVLVQINEKLQLL